MATLYLVVSCVMGALFVGFVLLHRRGVATPYYGALLICMSLVLAFTWPLWLSALGACVILAIFSFEFATMENAGGKDHHTDREEA